MWKYLFTVPPADIVKFDSTEYVAVPNEWTSSVENEIKVVRDNGDSTVNNNQIKVVSIDGQGEGYSFLASPIEVDILGDGTGGKVRVQTNTNGQLTYAKVTAGGQGYSYGRVDLSSINGSATKFAKLTPIIPPSRGHGYDLYKELGTDKVLIYTRFDSSTYDFISDTTFSQVGVVKNPVAAGAGSTAVLNTSEYSAASALKFTGDLTQTLAVGSEITQNRPGFGTARGYVASYDVTTRIIKYFQDRNLYLHPTIFDQTDNIGVGGDAKVLEFNSAGDAVISSGFSVNIDSGFSGISTTTPSGKVVDLGVQFTSGLAGPEINKRTGEIIYLDNRPSITRNERQKEDIKIVLEF